MELNEILEGKYKKNKTNGNKHHVDKAEKGTGMGRGRGSVMQRK